MTSGQLCAFFYADLGEGLFECKKCGRRKQAPGTGYSILLGRLERAEYPSTVQRLVGDTKQIHLDGANARSQGHLAEDARRGGGRPDYTK
ncbi:hypothetical protein GQ600_26086 [Phytophthora cactorum]|nr:hypothetical protein GQ600_26086 [Phytophthora cactorum]